MVLYQLEYWTTAPFQGMLQSAHAVQLKLENERILEKAFEDYPVRLPMLHGSHANHVTHVLLSDTGVSHCASGPLPWSWDCKLTGNSSQAQICQTALLCLLSTWWCYQVISHHHNHDLQHIIIHNLASHFMLLSACQEFPIPGPLLPALSLEMT